MRWALCPDCNRPMEVEYVNNGVCRVWHGVHCGWGQSGFADEDVFKTPEEALAARANPTPPEAFRYLTIAIHPRKRDGDRLGERHPTIEEAVVSFHHPLSTTGRASE